VKNVDSSEYDLSKIYDFKKLPDKVSGRCDNCGLAHFESSVKGGQFLRKCSNCGLTKSI